MATSGTMLNDFVSQNALIIVISAVLATAIAFVAYCVARLYVPTNTSNSVAVSDTQDKHSDSLTASKSNSDEPESGDRKRMPAVDPVYYCEHIQGEIKRVKQDVTTRKICESLSAEQIAEERERQRDQLAEIFKLMQQQEEKFGINSMEEMQDQMRLYADINDIQSCKKPSLSSSDDEFDLKK